MGSHVDKYLLPRFGELSIDAVDERRVQEFIADLNRIELAPKSIRNNIGVLKLVLGKSRWQDWNLASYRLFVRRSVWRGQEVTIKTKSENRTVNVEPALADILREYLNSRTSRRVFQTRNGTPFSKDNVRRKLVSVLDKLGLKPGGLHAFRHGRVSVLQEKGVPADLAKEWIGHSGLPTTSRYTHISPEFRERVAVAVGLFKPMLDPNGPNMQQTEVA